MSSQCRRVRAVMSLLAFAALSSQCLRGIGPDQPASVGIPGNYQSEAGCAGDWDPACPATQLVYDANGDIWRNTFSITPAGAYEYKVALNGSWDVNYGLHAQQNGPNIPLATTSFAAERHLLLRPQDPLGHRERQLHHRHRARQLPERDRLQRRLGSGLLPLLAAGHQRHVYLQLQHQRHSRRLLRGQGGAQRQLGRELRPGRRAERRRTSRSRCRPTAWKSPFSGTPSTKDLRVVVGGIHGDLTKAQAYWLSADTIAWNVPTDTVVTLFADPDGALTLDGPGVVAGAELEVLDARARPGGPVARAARAISASREPRGVQTAGRRRRGRRAEPERPARRRRGAPRPGRRCHVAADPRRSRRPVFRQGRAGHAGAQLQARTGDACAYGRRPRAT